MSITNEPIFKNFALSDFRKANLYWRMLVVGPVYMRKTHHLQDQRLAGELNFSHCLYELFPSPVSSDAERPGGVNSLFCEIRTN